MNPLCCLVVFTSNILGSFNDPFEFEGDYGEEMNSVRKDVFELVVSKEALARNLTDSQIKELIQKETLSKKKILRYRQHLVEKGFQEDLQRGPTLSELIPLELIAHLKEKQKELETEGFSAELLRDMLSFIERFGEQKIFLFFRNNPPDLLSLDKILRDKATREMRNFDLPILSSTQPFVGHTSLELKRDLLKSLFTATTFRVAKSETKIREAIEKFDPNLLKQILGEKASIQDLALFAKPVGQTFFYWLHQSLNIHLISQDQAMVAQINRVKQIFRETLGNAALRAQILRDQFIASDAAVVFTQESDALVPALFTENGLFHPIDRQNPEDGTFVFLLSDIWEPFYQTIAIDDYEGYHRGRLNLILAFNKQTNERFLLASAHGNSNRAEDGRLQISKIMEKFHLLSKLPENRHLQLIIGIDANTKSEEDVKIFRQHLDTLGLVATSIGPTTIKRRMVTAQHSKAGRFAIDEEDYLIVLKPENGGTYQMTDFKVGFQKEKPDPAASLPNIKNLSDHYPVSASLFRA
jgi:hypothetical protein